MTTFVSQEFFIYFIISKLVLAIKVLNCTNLKLASTRFFFALKAARINLLMGFWFNFNDK